MKTQILDMEGYEATRTELNELVDLRDKMEERGYSTSNIEAQIDELLEARAEFKNSHRKEFEDD